MSTEAKQKENVPPNTSSGSFSVKTVPFGVRTEQQLKALYKLAGKYNGDLKKKDTRMTAQIAKIVSAVDEYLASSSSTFSDESQADASAPPSRAQCHFWKGRAQDARDSYSPEAVESLSRAVKLEPGLVEGWNCLANCYWKNKNLKSAHSCLMTAMEQEKKASTMRMLSMVVKNLTSDSKSAEDRAREKKDNTKLGVTYAKDAVALDVTDSESWYVLGNAYLADFFVNTHDRATLQSALKAYSRSEGTASTNPDLYYNRGNILKYFEDYEAAISAYKKAAELDPALPTAADIEGLSRFVRKVAKLVSTRMGMKPRKLQAQLEGMPATPRIWGTEVKIQDVALSALQDGENPSKFFVGVIMAPVVRQDDTPVSFLVCDAGAQVSVVSLYNVASDLLDDLKPNQMIAVKSPIRKTVSLTEDTRHYAYPTVHCISAQNLLIDGAQLTRSNIAAGEMKMEIIG